ncbi:MAG: hypothetical protein ACO1NV_18065 [Leptospira bouyouniensis]|uniref:Lipoprotein n=1 Tax=Leptospira bouyouniensis TaxID=2484911 RepID=A0A7I0HPE8_9LEPT|nr:hypothetical protein [Leptospira bouyouniensis]TGK47340.1 hypothetical protein EHQ10_16200 [Leptospira bouyouniensis]TGL03562.1 hypothetical protein EHQ43_14750 [Leptospira bouyouniensis]TGM81148.1 hypothetical protein EHQ99_09735 [Leptospira bouyouniensis]
MRALLSKLLTIFLVSIFVSCSLFEKDDKKDKDVLNALLLSIWSYNLAAGCTGPKSGFTICIPKGIAE